MTQDLSSSVTDANNKLNQDSQIIQSDNNVAQSATKSMTDMMAKMVQGQISS